MSADMSGYTKEELIFFALNHDIGKMGFPGEGNETYIPNDSEWHRKNMGRMYKVNPNNQFTLGAGTYLIKWSAPVYNVDGHQTRLRNMSDLTTDIVGSSESDNSRSFGAGVISILENKTFEIQHRSETTVTDNGFGFNLDFGEDNIFTMVEVYKES